MSIYDYEPTRKTMAILRIAELFGRIAEKAPWSARIHDWLWNVADHRREPEYWWAILRLSMPSSYPPEPVAMEELYCDDIVSRYPTKNWAIKQLCNWH